MGAVRKRLISGIEVVTIPLSDYAALLKSKRDLAESAISAEQLVKPRRGRIDRDPEIAVYLALNLGLKSVKLLRKDCQRKFGASRTPSVQAIYRHWERLRIEARSAENSAAK
jgi:hypothetical protein